MHKNNPAFVAPADDAKIWRYMDLAKFMSLLEGRSLYFCRYDKFDDKFEGAWPRKNMESLLSGAGDGNHEEALKSVARNVMSWRKTNAINSCVSS